MRFSRLWVIATLTVGLGLPAGAQTTQTTPASPTGLAVPTSPSAAKAAAEQNGATAPTGLVDINSASAIDLDALPGIGKARAAAIIKQRPYKSKHELLSRHVLPANIYNGIKNKVIATHG